MASVCQLERQLPLTATPAAPMESRQSPTGHGQCPSAYSPAPPCSREAPVCVALLPGDQGRKTTGGRMAGLPAGWQAHLSPPSRTTTYTAVEAAVWGTSA